jgi:hypothetical protein
VSSAISSGDKAQVDCLINSALIHSGNLKFARTNISEMSLAKITFLSQAQRGDWLHGRPM